MGDPVRSAALGDRTAAALVFGSSAAVLVVELTALRLLAPYLGLTLETSTLVIGIALGAIALGSWSGGRAADRSDPRRLLGPLLGVSGVVVAITPAIVRTVAETAPELLTLVASLTILVPGAMLSAVTPDRHEAAPDEPRRDRDRRGPAVGHRHGRRDRRHDPHRLRAGLPGARERHPGRPRCRTGGRERAGDVAAARPVAVVGDRPRRRGRRAGHDGGARRVRRRDDVPLRPGRGRPRQRVGPDARPRHVAALVRRPRRPDAARVRLHPHDRVGDRRGVPAPAKRCAPTTWAAAD